MDFRLIDAAETLMTLQQQQEQGQVAQSSATASGQTPLVQMSQDQMLTHQHQQGSELTSTSGGAVAIDDRNAGLIYLSTTPPSNTASNISPLQGSSPTMLHTLPPPTTCLADTVVEQSQGSQQQQQHKSQSSPGKVAPSGVSSAASSASETSIMRPPAAPLSRPRGRGRGAGRPRGRGRGSRRGGVSASVVPSEMQQIPIQIPPQQNPSGPTALPDDLDNDDSALAGSSGTSASPNPVDMVEVGGVSVEKSFFSRLLDPHKLALLMDPEVQSDLRRARKLRMERLKQEKMAKNQSENQSGSSTGSGAGAGPGRGRGRGR